MDEAPVRHQSQTCHQRARGPMRRGPVGATRGTHRQKTAPAAAPSFVVQRTTSRPTYATKPRRKVTLTVIPPMRLAGHEMIEPRRVNLIGAPETATRTLV